jgi:transcriptional regulator with XRE-family HTH domain
VSELADNVRAARKKRGLTQEKLAALAGCCSRTVQNVESGRCYDLTIIDKLAPHLGKTTAQLLEQKEASKQ